MKILFCGINYAPELTGIGKYSGEMAPWLARKAGHEVKFVTAPPYYPEWRIGDGYSSCLYKREYLQGVDVIRCPLYVPDEITTLKRLLHLVTFALSSFLALLSQLLWRPDVVVVVVPTFFCAPFVWLFAKLCGAKAVIHIQDFELDAMLGLGMAGTGSSMGLKGQVIKVVKSIESFWLRRFDAVSTISYNMLAKSVEKGVVKSKTVFFPNWVDTDFITPDASGSVYRHDWNLTTSDRVVLYSGNIGNKQGLELVLEAAQYYKAQSEVQFVIVGQGAYRASLEKMAYEMQLDNLQFRDLVPYCELPKLMAMADVHLVVQKRGAADVVLPSKLTSILSAGGYALITAEPETELGLLCDKHEGIAERVEPENLDAFISGLDVLLRKNTTTYNKVARGYALDSLNKDSVLDAFNSGLQDLVKST